MKFHILPALILSVVMSGCATYHSSFSYQEWVNCLNETIHRSEEEFASCFSHDANLDHLHMWYRNFTVMKSVLFISTDDGISVEWQMANEDTPARHDLSAVLTCHKDCEVDDLIQKPGSPVPIWLDHEMVQRCESHLCVIGSSEYVDRIMISAIDALNSLKESALSSVLDLERITVELPCDSDHFERIMASPAFNFRSSGAISWREGEAGRIVINPISYPALERQMTGLLAHEITHQALHRWGHAAPGRQWVSEGIAEYHSCQVKGDQCTYQFGFPPADDDFEKSNGSHAYRWAAGAVSAIIDHESDPIDTLHRLWDNPDMALPVYLTA